MSYIHKDLIEIDEKHGNDRIKKVDGYQYIMSQEGNVIGHIDLVIMSAYDILSKIENKTREEVKEEIEKKSNKSKRPEFEVPKKTDEFN